MAFKMKGFSGFKKTDLPKLRTESTDRGGKRKIETVSTRVSDQGSTADQFDEKVTVTKRGGKVKKVYDSKTGEKTKIKYDKEGNVKKAKTRKTSGERIQKLARKSGTTIKDQVREIPTIRDTQEWAREKRSNK